MRLAIWTIFGLLALLWTGGAFAVSGLAGWAAQLLASGEAVRLGGEVARWPVPQWVSLWVDPAWVRAMQEALLWAVQALRDLVPLLGPALDWLVPLVWMLWGLGLVLMLVLAGGARLLLGRLPRARPRSA